jgi:hypothetical protein
LSFAARPFEAQDELKPCPDEGQMLSERARGLARGRSEDRRYVRAYDHMRGRGACHRLRSLRCGRYIGKFDGGPLRKAGATSAKKKTHLARAHG